MKAKKCGMSEEEKHFRRLNYCGTCKTIGSLYGQKSRLLLNHDTVFLAELLSALSGENVAGWQKSYQSFNCLSLPKNELPAALRFAATTNVILTEFKLADHVSDEGKRRYKMARGAFSGEFRKAESLLKSWDFPLAEVREILETQVLRETTEKSLDALAFPTAQTTAVFFREGVRQIGRRELAASAFELGFAFGKLVYLLDAFEDYEKDFRTRRFNAFRAAFNLKDAQLTAETKRRITPVLRALESGIAEKINLLPLAERQKSLFISRLAQNLHKKLETHPPVLKTKQACAVKPPPTFKEKWRQAAARARELTRPYRWQMPLVFLFVFVFALVAPAYSREAKSARECFDLSFNLMFIGAIFGSVLAFPKAIPAMTPEEILAEEERKRQMQNAANSGGGDAGGDGWCDWCDCCDCEDCGCDNCDCCSGCCDNCGCDGCCDGCDCSCD